MTKQSSKENGLPRADALAMTGERVRNVTFISHCEEWNDEAVYGLPRAYALAMTKIKKGRSQ